MSHGRPLRLPSSRRDALGRDPGFRAGIAEYVERSLGNEMLSLGYSPEGSRGHVHSPEEERAKRHALRHYDEIATGKLRRQQRVRMARKMWLHRHFGPALALFPAKRLAVTRDDWVKRAASLAARSDASGAGGD